MEHFRKLERMYAAAPINAWFAPKLTVGQGEAEVRILLRPDFHHAAGAAHQLPRPLRTPSKSAPSFERLATDL